MTMVTVPLAALIGVVVGMQFGLSWLEQADELWVFGDTVSEGMAQEIARAKELGKPVRIPFLKPGEQKNFNAGADYGSR